MKKEYVLIALFILVCSITFYLSYQIIVPFFVPISWAAVFAILFYPLYEKFYDKMKSKGLASASVCIIIVLLIIGPMTYLFAALVNEAVGAVSKVNEMYQSGELDELVNVDLPLVASIKEKLSGYFDISKIDMSALARDAVNKVSGTLVNQTAWVVANFTRAIFYFGLMMFTMYYFFEEGESIISQIKRLMPFTHKQTEITFKQLRDVIQATIYGGVAIALIQGLMGGILFLIVGIPSPVFWGAIMAFLSIIPLIGAFLVYVPAGIILALGGYWVKGLIVIAVGTLVISQVDNVIRPFLISGKASMHPLILFFSLLGGISLFGLLGIVLGPMIGALFMTLIKTVDLKMNPDDELPVASE